MKHIKRIALCEQRVLIVDPWVPEGTQQPCLYPANYLRDFTDPKTKPQHLCGIHANMLKKRGIKVRAI